MIEYARYPTQPAPEPVQPHIPSVWLTQNLTWEYKQLVSDLTAGGAPSDTDLNGLGAEG